MKHSKFNPVPFHLRSRQQRNQCYIDIKNKIRRSAPVLGGNFFTHDYIHGENGWLDVYFPAHKAPNFYNVTLQTTRYAYRELVRDRAFDLSYELAPESEPSLFDRMVKNPQTGLYEAPPREPLRYPELNQMTRYAWIESQLPVIADSGNISVFEEWEIDREYAYGIGVHATLNVPYLDIATIGIFVRRFMEKPNNFHDPAPRTYRYDQIKYWGLESNALIDPWDWPLLGETRK